MAADVLAWSVAWEEASFSDGGFYRRLDGAAERHFATHVTDGPRTARRILEIALPMLRELVARHRTVTVTDAGAGDGTLLRQLSDLCPPDLLPGIHWRGLDLRERPPGLPSGIEWVTGDIRRTAPGLTPSSGLVIAHELLDDIPCDVAEIDDDGRVRVVMVDRRTGRQALGPTLDDDDACAGIGLDAARARYWLTTWWPSGASASRREIGLSRDEAWQTVAGTVSHGLAIAIDYAHVQQERAGGRWDGGTLTGYREGRQVSPVPDGSCNLTAHVAIDSCAAAVAARGTVLTRLRDTEDFWWLVQEMGR